MAVVDLIVRFIGGAATTGISGVTSALSGLGGAASTAASQTQGLSGAIASGIIQADALQFVVSKAAEAVSGLQKSFAQAQKLQLQALSAANTFATQTGQSLGSGEELIERLNQRLAVAAAALPGTTQDYKNLATQIQDNLIPAFKEAGGGFNTKGFEDAVYKISESYGALNAIGGGATSQVNLFLTKALSGANEASLRILKFAQSNPAVLGNIREELTKVGKKSLRQVDIAKRVEILQKIGEKAITKEFKDKASNTVEGLVQTYKSNLFDPTSGIFGVMRDLDPTLKGSQSVFAAFNDALKSLIGTDGLLNRFGGLMKSLGLGGDPMATLRQGILLFNNLIVQVNEQVAVITTFVSVTKEALSLGTINFSDVGLTIGKNVSEFLGAAVSSIQAELTKAQTFLGEKLSQAPGILGNFLTIAGSALSQGVQNLAAKFLNLPVGTQLTIGAVGAAGAFLFFNTAVGQTVIALGALMFSYIPVAISGITAIGNAVIFAGTAFAAGATGVLRFTFALPGLINAGWATAVSGIKSVGTAISALSAETIWLSLTTKLTAGGVAIRSFASTVAIAGDVAIRSFASTIVTAIFALASTIATAQIAVVSGIRSVVTAITTLSVGSIWSSLTTGLAAGGVAIRSFASTVATAGAPLLANPLVLGIGAIALAAVLIYKYWNPITQFFQGFVEGLMSALAPIMPILTATGSAIASALSPLISVLSPLIDLFKATWNWLTQLLTPVQDADGAARNLGKTLGEIVGGGIMVAVNAVKELLNWLGQGLEKLKSFAGIATQATGGLAQAFNFQLPSATSTPTPPAAIVGARHSGHIGTAATGFLGDLLGAANKEMAAMPSQAQLLIANTSETIIPQGMLGVLMRAASPQIQLPPVQVANTSETIIPQGMLGALMRAASPQNQMPSSVVAPQVQLPPVQVAVPSARTGNTVNLQLTINAPAGDASAIADVAINAIQQLFEAELSTQLG